MLGAEAHAIAPAYGFKSVRTRSSPVMWTHDEIILSLGGSRMKDEEMPSTIRGGQR